MNNDFPQAYYCFSTTYFLTHQNRFVESIEKDDLTEARNILENLPAPLNQKILVCYSTLKCGVCLDFWMLKMLTPC